VGYVPWTTTHFRVCPGSYSPNVGQVTGSTFRAAVRGVDYPETLAAEIHRLYRCILGRICSQLVVRRIRRKNSGPVRAAIFLDP
jgi:hypothetical protein